MATRTSNLYGRITVTNRAIRDVANAAIIDCYGVACGRVALITTDENRIFLSIHLWLRYGVTPQPVCDSVRQAVKYHVEEFTGMAVRAITIQVKGIV